jgi:hypothetical protein
MRPAPFVTALSAALHRKALGQKMTIMLPEGSAVKVNSTTYEAVEVAIEIPSGIEAPRQLSGSSSEHR